MPNFSKKNRLGSGAGEEAESIFTCSVYPHRGPPAREVGPAEAGLPEPEAGRATESARDRSDAQRAPMPGRAQTGGNPIALAAGGLDSHCAGRQARRAPSDAEAIAPARKRGWPNERPASSGCGVTKLLCGAGEAGSGLQPTPSGCSPLVFTSSWRGYGAVPAAACEFPASPSTHPPARFPGCPAGNRLQRAPGNPVRFARHRYRWPR